MRTSHKAFLLGIVFTSVTWSVILYFYFSLQYPIAGSKINAVHSVPTSSSQDPEAFPIHAPENKKHFDPAVISNHIDDEESGFQHSSEKASRHKKKRPASSKMDELETNLGLVKNKEDQKMREEGYSRHAFNTLVSSRLDYHREIPDSRHKM